MGNLFTIPAGGDFLDILATHLLDGNLIPGFLPSRDPLALHSATIFVPSRRAGRALAEVFIKKSGRGAAILPKIRMLGDIHDEEFGLLPGDNQPERPEGEVSWLERTLILSELVQSWTDQLSEETRRLYGEEEILIPSNASDSIYFADELGKLLDQLTLEEASWELINNAIPREHTQWWQITTTFLRIIFETWPKYLEEENLVDKANRSAQLLWERARKYREEGSDGPVIIAGSTGSVPSTRSLVDAVSKLPMGAVVLPGYDTTLTSEEIALINNGAQTGGSEAECHPQYGLVRLTTALGANPQDIQILGTTDRQTATRARIVSTSMMPSQLTDQWRGKMTDLPPTAIHSSLEQVCLIESPNEQSEAASIAVAVRELLEDETKTAAIVTPDRKLANRVAAELTRFGVQADDTAGTEIAESEAGRFLRQVVQMCFAPPSNIAIATLLKNPRCLCGSSPDCASQVARVFELLVLRGRPGSPQTGHFAQALANVLDAGAKDRHVQSAIDKIGNAACQLALEHLKKLDQIVAPLCEIAQSEESWPVAELCRASADAADKLGETQAGTSGFLAGDGGPELNEFLLSAVQIPAHRREFLPLDFPSVLEAMMSGLAARSNIASHPRIRIYGPLEFRLLRADLVILAGLNEETWPNAGRNGAFLNRALRQELDLPTAERRVGLAAHDFQQMMGIERVVLSRSTRVDSAPTVASRWLQRLLAVIGEDEAGKLRQRGHRYFRISRIIDHVSTPPQRPEAPSPIPDVQLRPKVLPVTDIETWIRDPYALYAKRILKLSQIPPLVQEADPRIRGIFYHRILQLYVDCRPASYSQEEKKHMLEEIARKELERLAFPEDVSNVWRFRFAQIADAFIDWENTLFEKCAVRRTATEVSGQLKLLDGSFTLTARADRIDQFEDGSLQIVDYKTGAGPSPAQARSFSAQLALEGAIARQGGFEEFGPSSIQDMRFLRLRRGEEFQSQGISDSKNPVDRIINTAIENLCGLITAYRDPAMAYASRIAPFKEKDMSGEYDHLARVREWSFGGEHEDG